MRLYAPFSLFFLLAGCVRNMADHVGPREGIVAPELVRYGFDLRETKCVSQQLAKSLHVLLLRRLRRATETVTQGYFDPDRLTPRDLAYVASQVDPKIAEAVSGATTACEVETGPPKPPVAAVPKSDALANPLAPNWLNLGKAESGQGIAIDASTIEREAMTRKAWFRLFNPDGKPSDEIFLLQVDCAAKTIDPRKQRTLDASGGILAERDFPSVPTPLEAGTVTAIAYLSLCT